MVGWGGRRVRARGLREMAKITKPCRPGPLTGRFSRHALRLVFDCLILPETWGKMPTEPAGWKPALHPVPTPAPFPFLRSCVSALRFRLPPWPAKIEQKRLALSRRFRQRWRPQHDAGTMVVSACGQPRMLRTNERDPNRPADIAMRPAT